MTALALLDIIGLKFFKQLFWKEMTEQLNIHPLRKHDAEEKEIAKNQLLDPKGYKRSKDLVTSGPIKITLKGVHTIF